MIDAIFFAKRFLKLFIDERKIEKNGLRPGINYKFTPNIQHHIFVINMKRESAKNETSAKNI